jgi:hypothetical protein
MFYGKYFLIKLLFIISNGVYMLTTDFTKLHYVYCLHNRRPLIVTIYIILKNKYNDLR